MKLTQRKINGLYIIFSVFAISIVSFFIYEYVDTLNNVIQLLNIDWLLLNKKTILIVTFTALNIILGPTILMWSYRNKIWEGKRAYKRYLMTLRIRRALLDANYHDDRFNFERVAKLPQIKVVFEDKNMLHGKLFIRDSLVFHERLKTATFTPVLKNYKVETSYLSDEGDWYIFEFYEVSTEFQEQFIELHDFLNWTNETSNHYQLRYDQRLTSDLKHTLLVGATRTGKTYGLIGLMIQMVNKPINFNLYFADPKNDQVRKIGHWINSRNTAVTTDEIINLISRVYEQLIEREKEMATATAEIITGDYRSVELEPIILIFDEFSSFISVLDNNQKKIVLGQLTAVVQRGAGAGLFLFLIMQKSESSTLPTAIRSNLLLKIVLGNAPNTTYTTAFESSQDIPEFKFRIGQGVYLDDTMSKPALFSFPHLKFLDAYNDGRKNPATLWSKKIP